MKGRKRKRKTCGEDADDGSILLSLPEEALRHILSYSLLSSLGVGWNGWSDVPSIANGCSIFRELVDFMTYARIGGPDRFIDARVGFLQNLLNSSWMRPSKIEGAACYLEVGPCMEEE